MIKQGNTCGKRQKDDDTFMVIKRWSGGGGNIRISYSKQSLRQVAMLEAKTDKGRYSL